MFLGVQVNSSARSLRLISSSLGGVGIEQGEDSDMTVASLALELEPGGRTCLEVIVR